MERQGVSSISALKPTLVELQIWIRNRITKYYPKAVSSQERHPQSDPQLSFFDFRFAGIAIIIDRRKQSSPYWYHESITIIAAIKVPVLLMSCSHTPRILYHAEPQNTPIQSHPNTKNPRTRTTPLIYTAEGIKPIYPLSLTKAAPGDPSGGTAGASRYQPRTSRARSRRFENSPGFLHVLVHLYLEVMPYMTRVAGTPDMQRRHERRRREEQPAAHLVSTKPPSPCTTPPPLPSPQHPGTGARTYHSKAANAAPAFAALQTVPKQTRSLRKTARAMDPASQNSIVRASAARMPDLCAAAGKRAGATTR